MAPTIRAVVEEQLKVGKREVSRGRVRVISRVTERPTEDTIRLREQHAVIERRPANRAATQGDIAGFREGVVEIPETAEEAVVSKSARVVEEVVVGTETTERNSTIRDKVRKTDVQVDREGTTTRGPTGSNPTNRTPGRRR